MLLCLFVLCFYPDYVSTTINMCNKLSRLVFARISEVTDYSLMYVTFAGAPDAPRNIEVVEITKTHITLSWESGFDGGSVQTFVVEYKRDKLDWTARVFDCGPKQNRRVFATLTGLKSATNYLFRISTKNFY